jgi:CheY-like chemotaxis protein
MGQTAPVVILSPDLETQELYVYALRSRRRPAYGTGSLEDTLTLARHTRPAAIVVDVRQQADWQLCQALHNDSATRDVPLVALTAFVTADGRYRQLAEDAGCAAYLAKPSVPSALEHAVDRVIGDEHRTGRDS